MIIPQGPTDVCRSRAPVILPALFRRASLPIVTPFSPPTFGFTDALHGLSRALQDLNRLDEAIEVSKQISEIDPDDILAHTSVEEVLLRLLETQEEQDRWLLENREAINAKIRRGIEQLERGEGVPEDRLDSHLAKLKAKPE